MDETLIAYLAGAMDSDGSFGIRRSTYAMRIRGDATQPVYSERVLLKQVTEAIPRLLHETFGGSLRIDPPSTACGKPLWGWQATDTNAAKCAAALLPFLRVKHKQAQCLLDLRASKDRHEFKKLAYWFAQEHPNWRDLPMITYAEAALLIGYAGIGMVSQAVRNGSLLALPYDYSGRGGDKPRIPRLLVEQYIATGSSFRGKIRPAPLIAMREALWQRCRELNRIGIGEHPIYMRTGCFEPTAT